MPLPEFLKTRKVLVEVNAIVAYLAVINEGIGKNQATTSTSAWLNHCGERQCPKPRNPTPTAMLL